jgi:hypothetical protein
MMTLSGLDSVILLILTNRRITCNVKTSHSKVFGVMIKTMGTPTITGMMSLTLTEVHPMKDGKHLSQEQTHAFAGME